MPHIDLSKTTHEQTAQQDRNKECPSRYFIEENLRDTLAQADKMEVFKDTVDAAYIHQKLQTILKMLSSYNSLESWKESARDAQRRGYDL